MRFRVFLAPLVAAILIPDLARAQTAIPPYAQPDPHATAAGAPPAEGPPPAETAPPDAAITARAKEWLHRAQTGDFDRSQLEPQVDKAITPDAAKAAAASLNALGKPTTFTYVDTIPGTPNLKTYVYRVTFPSRTMNWLFTLDQAGKIAGIYLRPETADEQQGPPPQQ